MLNVQLGSSWLLIVKFGEERNDLKTELLSKEQSDLRDLEISQPFHIAKKSTLTVWASYHWQWGQYGWEACMDLATPEGKLPIWTEGEKIGRNKGRPSDFLDFIGAIWAIWNQLFWAIWLRTCSFFKTREESPWRQFRGHQDCLLRFKSTLPCLQPARWHLPKAVRVGPLSHLGARSCLLEIEHLCPNRSKRWDCHPWGAEEQSMMPKNMKLKPEIS